MDTPIKKYRTGFGIFGRIFLYKDHLVIKGLFTKKIIPSHKVANVAINKFLLKLVIETSGGEHTVIPFTFFSSFMKLSEIQNQIMSIANQST